MYFRRQVARRRYHLAQVSAIDGNSEVHITNNYATTLARFSRKLVVFVQFVQTAVLKIRQ